ncbi:MAG: hypothetical protein JWP35_2773 [Caulobacter sp.]|nr:hypothetical protein [Caulobacter sp.]
MTPLPRLALIGGLIALMASPVLVQAAEPPAGGPAPTLSAQLRASNDGQYPAFKQVFGPMLAAETKARRAEGEDQSGPYDLYLCNNGAGYMGYGEGADELSLRATYQVDLAYEVVTWSQELKARGYPPAVWGPLLARYEAERLAEAPKESDVWSDTDPDFGSYQGAARDRFMTKLKTALRAYRRAHPGLRLANIIIEGGCGAGENSISVTTSPRGGTVSFIPLFFYKLCSARGINPDDPNKCDRWREAPGGSVTEVAGDYAYVARWPDGAIKRGTLRFGDLGTSTSVVFSKP